MTIYKGIGKLKNLGKIVESYDRKKILIVSGKKSFASSGAEEIVKKQLSNYELHYFSDFQVNPDYQDAQRGARFAANNKIDLIVSIGGGSVLDMGKLIKAFYPQPDQAKDIVEKGLKIIDSRIPIISVPTTAGSGSESTHFAVVYVKDQKYSLSARSLIANDIILDGSLVLSASKYQKACS